MDEKHDVKHPINKQSSKIVMHQQSFSKNLVNIRKLENISLVIGSREWQANYSTVHSENVYDPDIRIYDVK